MSSRSSRADLMGGEYSSSTLLLSSSSSLEAKFISSSSLLLVSLSSLRWFGFTATKGLERFLCPLEIDKIDSSKLLLLIC